MNEIEDIYEEAKKLGVEIDHHESDLYIPVTPETKELVKRYTSSSIVTTFTNQIDHKPWFDLPFAYSPFWEKKGKKPPCKHEYMGGACCIHCGTVP